MKNQFFNPDTCPFEVFGFVEDLVCAETYKALGSRPVAELTRPTGSPGMITFTLTENVILTKGMKQILIKASSQRPRRVIGTIQILCGRTK